MKPQHLFAGALALMAMLIVGVIVMTGGDAKEKKQKKEEDVCGCCAQIRTPNGRPGIYCSDLQYENNGRRRAYQYVSRHCQNGYDFVRENENAFMVECKGDLLE